ncbi:MAG: septum formation inhibitor Maf [Cyanobium sp. CACIAM 14]|nr:MAG: septum formation inhibitor Maf [Cyanobium sp. CACIAM 14]
MLTLASASPARRRLLEQAGLVHRVRVSGVDEASVVDADPQRLVQRLAQAKATVVAQALAAEGISFAAGVLGCDSVLVLGDEVCGKPRDAVEAAARWRRMAGGWGDLHTGHCLVTGTVAGGGLEARQAVVTTRVCFAPLTEAEIQAYVATGEPLACAGAFALEGRGGLLVERIEGCFSNVIGLSLPLLRRWLSAGSPVQG